MKKCKFCNGSGKKLIGLQGFDFIKVPCKKCNGKGMK